MKVTDMFKNDSFDGSTLKEKVEEIITVDSQNSGDDKEDSIIVDSPSDNSSDSDEISFKPFIKELYDKNLLLLEETDLDDLDDSIEGFSFAIEQTVNKKVEEEAENKFNFIISELPELTQKLIEISRNGGDISELLQVNETNYEDIDIDDEDNQKLIIQDYFEKKGYDEEYITEKLQKFEETGKIESVAKDYHKALIKYQKTETENLIKKEEEAAKQREADLIKEQELAFKEAKVAINNIEEVDGIKLSKQDKDKLYDYMYKPIAKDEHGNLYTQWMIDNHTEESKYRHAFRMMNQDKIIKNVETNTKSKVSNDIYKELNKNKQTTTVSRDTDFKKTTYKPTFVRESFN